MKVALIVYWVWHLTMVLVSNLYVSKSLETSILITHLNYLSLWFIVLYTIGTMVVMQEKINQKILWFIFSSLCVRAVIFHVQLELGSSVYLTLSIYGFGLLVFLLLEKYFKSLTSKFHI